jgi:hypothetical protein
MGIFDQLALRAPGALGQALQGRNQGAIYRQKREQEQAELAQRAAERAQQQAMQQSLMDFRVGESQYRRGQDALAAARQAEVDKRDEAYRAAQIANMRPPRDPVEDYRSKLEVAQEFGVDEFKPQQGPTGSWSYAGIDPASGKPILLHSITGQTKIGDSPIGAKPSGAGQGKASESESNSYRFYERGLPAHQERSSDFFPSRISPTQRRVPTRSDSLPLPRPLSLPFFAKTLGPPLTKVSGRWHTRSGSPAQGTPPRP